MLRQLFLTLCATAWTLAVLPADGKALKEDKPLTDNDFVMKVAADEQDRGVHRPHRLIGERDDSGQPGRRGDAATRRRPLCGHLHRRRNGRMFAGQDLSSVASICV